MGEDDDDKSNVVRTADDGGDNESESVQQQPAKTATRDDAARLAATSPPAPPTSDEVTSPFPRHTYWRRGGPDTYSEEEDAGYEGTGTGSLELDRQATTKYPEPSSSRSVSFRNEVAYYHPSHPSYGSGEAGGYCDQADDAFDARVCRVADPGVPARFSDLPTCSSGFGLPLYSANRQQHRHSREEAWTSASNLKDDQDDDDRKMPPPNVSSSSIKKSPAPAAKPQQRQQRRPIISFQPCYVERVGEDDVLLGRGPLVYNHGGNLQFHREKLTLQAEYVRAPNSHKKAISQRLVDAIRQRGGNFLAFDWNVRRWYVVDNDRAVSKSARALREVVGKTAKLNKATAKKKYKSATTTKKP